jgi:hypothetical protein
MFTQFTGHTATSFAFRCNNLRLLAPTATSRLARTLALQGETAKAKAAYQDFPALWKAAAPHPERSHGGVRETTVVLPETLRSNAITGIMHYAPDSMVILSVVEGGRKFPAAARIGSEAVIDTVLEPRIRVFPLLKTACYGPWAVTPRAPRRDTIFRPGFAVCVRDFPVSSLISPPIGFRLQKNLVNYGVLLDYTQESAPLN